MKDFQEAGTKLKFLARVGLRQALSSLPERIQIFALNHCVLSGGCFVSLLHEQKVNDWDLWCIDAAKIPIMEELLASYTKEEADEIPVENPAYMEQFVDGKIITVNAITLKNKVQFIKMTDFTEAKKSFDFEHCRISYYPGSEVMYMSQTQFECIRDKQLIPTRPLNEYKDNVMRRLNKFTQRGWKYEV